MTSNIGADLIKGGGGFGFGKRDESQLREDEGHADEGVERYFRPEFINRLDDVIVFRPLTRDDLKQIVDSNRQGRQALAEHGHQPRADRGQGVPDRQGLQPRLRRPAAASGDRAPHRGPANAVVKVIAAQVPEAFAIVALLCGEYAAARGAIDTLTRTAMRNVSSWPDPLAPQRWFRHHAVLQAREAGRSCADDTTIFTPVEHARPAELPAFLKALRSLESQQQEAFLLHYGLSMGPRALAVAMDCSTTAAGNHLGAAENALRPLAGGAYDPLVNIIRECAGQLLIVENPTQYVENRYRRRARKRNFDRLLGLLVALVILGTIAWFAWPHRDTIQQQIEQTFDDLTAPSTAPTTAPASPAD
jgi:DNA-directed RNA polymerase specialized sigma24 family protein